MITLFGSNQKSLIKWNKISAFYLFCQILKKYAKMTKHLTLFDTIKFSKKYSISDKNKWESLIRPDLKSKFQNKCQFFSIRFPPSVTHLCWRPICYIKSLFYKEISKFVFSIICK